MKNLLFFAGLLIFFASCDGTFVTKNIIDSKTFTFEHAGEVQNLLIELKEIKTFTRRNGIFSGDPGPVERTTTFDYAIYASVSDNEGAHEIFEYPCKKEEKLDDFISKIQIKRSNDRTHFALGYNNQTIGVWHSMMRVSFLAAYPLNPKGFDSYEFNKLNFNKFNKPRKDLLAHVTKSNTLLVSDKQLHDILIKLKPQDELNYELSYVIAEASFFQNEEYQKSIINHCKNDKNWRYNALKSIKNKKSNLSNDQYISRLHAIGGNKELLKEDEYQYKIFKSTGDFQYFHDRISNATYLFPEKIKKNLIVDFKYKLTHVCNLTSTEINQFYESIEFAEKLGVKKPFDLFFESYQKSNCYSKTLYTLSDEFLFPSVVLGESDKRAWINFVVKNFASISSTNRSWAYSRIENHISCEQKRALLQKYKKDIDTFDDMEIPECR
jgi:hypothetical protein